MTGFRPSDRQILILCELLVDRWCALEKAGMRSAYKDELWDLLCDMNSEAMDARGLALEVKPDGAWNLQISAPAILAAAQEIADLPPRDWRAHRIARDMGKDKK